MLEHRLQSFGQRYKYVLSALVGLLLLTFAAGGATPVRRARFALSGDVHRWTTDGLSEVAMAEVWREPKLTTAHFVVAYPPGRRSDAQVVAGALERFYPEVTAQLHARPTGRVPVIVESTAGMAATFGTTPSEAPLGAYWRGVLWFLAPSAYLEGQGASLAAAFDRYGPAPHEFTHLLDDLRTGGRLPPWLDEGNAQYVEWRDNGYVWRVPANNLDQPLYTWKQLATRFDHLSNQALAYRESFLVVRAIGPHDMNELLTRIGAGQSADAALRAILGPTRYRALAGGAAWKASTATSTARRSPPAPTGR